jgi:hypothetical protein
MKRFWKRQGSLNDLEAQLRLARSTPRKELVENVLAQLSETPGRAPRARTLRALRVRSPRTAMAAVVSVIALVAFAAFGGLGYAKSGASGALSNVAHSVSKVVKPSPTKSSDHGDQTGGPGKDADIHGIGNNGNGNGDNGNSNENEGNKGSAASEDQYQEKVLICHGSPPGKPNKFNTLKVSSQAAASHLRNHPFDYLGPCRGS